MLGKMIMGEVSSHNSCVPCRLFKSAIRIGVRMGKRRTQPISLTVEEAVALLINFDYIPSGFSILDMTAAFYESAAVDHHNAKLDHVAEERLEALLFRKTACMARHSLATSLMEHLNNELRNPEKMSSLLSPDVSSRRRISVEGLMNWASENYGIGVVPVQLSSGDSLGVVQAPDCSSRWEDATVKIYADYRIGYSINNGKYVQRHFREIDLMGVRKNIPNAVGATLIGLSHGRKFPTGKTAEAKDKTALTRLRDALKKLTGISSDPFFPINEGDGWKPRFKLVDARTCADERAKKEAIHEGFDEEHHGLTQFDDESDAAGKWLEENG